MGGPFRFRDPVCLEVDSLGIPMLAGCMMSARLGTTLNSWRCKLASTSEEWKTYISCRTSPAHELSRDECSLHPVDPYNLLAHSKKIYVTMSHKTE